MEAKSAAQAEEEEKAPEEEPESVNAIEVPVNRRWIRTSEQFNHRVLQPTRATMLTAVDSMKASLQQILLYQTFLYACYLYEDCLGSRV